MEYVNWIVLSKNIMRYLLILSALHWRYSYAIDDKKVLVATNKPLIAKNQERFFLDAEFQVPPSTKPTTSSFIAPLLNMQAFNQKLVPMIGANVKQNLQKFVYGVDQGVAVMKNAVKAQFQQVSHKKRHVRNNFRHKPIPVLHAAPSMVKYQVYGKPMGLVHPQSLTGRRSTAATTTKETKKPETQYRYDKSGKLVSAVVPASESGGKVEKLEFKEYKNLKKDMGIDGYKHFEASVIRDLEKKEEKNVEATMHSNLHSDNVVTGKQYGYDDGWVPVTTTPTKLQQTPVRTSKAKEITYKAVDSAPKPKSVGLPKQKATRLNVQKQETKHIVRHEHPPTIAATITTTDSKRDSKLLVLPEAETQKDDQPAYLEGIDKFLPDKNQTDAATRQHVQSLTTRKPKSSYVRNNSLYAQETKTVVASEKPPKQLKHYASQSVVPSSIRPTTAMGKFVDKPKETGFRGKVKFGDKVERL